MTTTAEEEKIIIKPKETSVQRLLSSENLKNVFKEIFSNAVIMSTEVKRGAKSSANIYVNRKYEGLNATVIIWTEKTK